MHQSSRKGCTMCEGLITKTCGVDSRGGGGGGANVEAGEGRGEMLGAAGSNGQGGGNR